MNSIEDLKAMLISRFEPFVVDQTYKKAFDRSVEILEKGDETQFDTNHDMLYMFMHSLIISLFEEIDRLESELTRLKNNLQ